MTASPIRRVLLAAGSRGATAPLTAVAAALTTYIAIQYAGAATFGYISLLGTLFQLLPFSDLGLGAAVINAVSTRGRAMDGEQQARDVTSRAFKSLLLVGVIVVFLSGMFGLLNLWPAILATPPGSDPRVDAAAFVVFVLVGLAIPLGLGQRLLVADNATHIATLIMGTSSVVAVLTTALLAFLSAPPLLLAAATPAGILVAAAISTWLGARRLGWRLGDLLKRQSLGEANRQSLWKPALPMMVVLLGAPLALQSHRLILAHYGNPAQLAEYAVGSQFYAPALSVITTGALALWPHFAGANSGKLRAWRASMWLMTVIGVVGGVAVASALGPVSSLITGGELTVSLPVSLGFATLILLMSIHQPSAMLLTDTRGLWFQATCMVLFAAIALPASIAMVRPMGTAGPLFATSAAVLLTTIVPCITRAARNLHRDV